MQAVNLGYSNKDKRGVIQHLKRPKCYEWILVYDGKSGLWIIPNGFGKTGIADGFYSLLSKDSDLFASIKGRLSPFQGADKSKIRPPSHLRVEFLVLKHAITGEVDFDYILRTADRHVLGLYGHSDGEVMMYSYSGPLSDLPLYKSEDGLVATGYTRDMTLLNHEEYREILESKGAEITLECQETKRWDGILDQYLTIPKDVIQQLCEFQKSGGDDKAASLFKYKKINGLSHQASFFYQKIAPELYRNVVYESGTKESTGGKRRYHLMDTLYQEGLRLQKFVKASLRSKEDFEHLGRDVKNLDKLLKAACRRKGLSNIQGKAKEIHEDTLAAYEQLCSGGILTGMPTWSSSGDPEIDILTRHMLIDHEQGLLLSTRGLGVLFNAETRLLADLKSIQLSARDISDLSGIIVDSTNIKNVLPNYSHSGRAVTEKACLECFQNINPQKSILNGRNPHAIASLVSEAFKFARSNIWNDQARLSLELAQREVEAWKLSRKVSIQNAQRYISEQIGFLEQQKEELDKSPARDAKDELTCIIEGLQSETAGLTPEGYQDAVLLRDLFSDLGTSVTEVVKAKKAKNKEFKEREDKLQLYVKTNTSLYAALMKCGEDVDKFLEERSAKVEEMRELAYEMTSEAEAIQDQIGAVEKGRAPTPSKVLTFRQANSDIHTTSLTKWVEEHVSDMEERQKVLTAYSALLYCPVCDDYASASKLAAREAEDETVSIPILCAEGLANQTKTIVYDSEQRVAISGLIVGGESPTVRVLMDTNLTSKRLEELRAQKQQASEAARAASQHVTELSKIESVQVSQLIENKHLTQEFPQMKTDLKRIESEKKNFEKRFTNYSEKITSALAFENTLRNRETIFEDVERFFQLLAEAEEVKPIIAENLIRHEASVKNAKIFLDNKIVKHRNAQKKITEYVMDVFETQVENKQKEVDLFKEAYSRYFSALRSIQEGLLDFRKYEIGKHFKHLPSIPPLGGKITDGVVKKANEISNTLRFTCEGLNLAASEILDNLTPITKRWKSNEDYFGRAGNLFQVRKMIAEDIGDQNKLMNNHYDFFSENMSRRFPSDTKLKLKKATDKRSFGVLLREIQTVKDTLLERMENHNETLEAREAAKRELVDQLSYFARKGLNNLRTLRRVCDEPDNTLDIQGNAIAHSDISTVVEDTIESFVLRATEPDKTPKLSDLELDFYKRVFKDPRVKVIHSTINPSGVKFDLEANVSTGEDTAIGLLMLTKLKQFAMARAAMSNQKAQGDFVLVDGLFSNLSKDELWEGSLSNLSSSQGHFQLIGFLHNMNFVNNFDIFPIVYYGIPQSDISESAYTHEEWAKLRHARNEIEVLLAKGWKESPPSEEGEAI
ncbi:hypothetical protein [uncultured Pseudodesulfovibrio sp.]|uniref:hypothetical protein n=1 Tax=uncultured Pseudodesulfovibrio sp. TaxID=2035858 RepID=UPI003748AFD9